MNMLTKTACLLVALIFAPTFSSYAAITLMQTFPNPSPGLDSYYGYSVSNAGDVNNDGWDDVIVGASGYDGNVGRAYIYYGGAAMNNTADVVITGEAAGNSFGESVSGAGDVNNDGYDDVIVGSSYYNGGTGRAYIFYGGSMAANIPAANADVIITGVVAGGYYLGKSVSGAGDVNRDGYDDVIVGAYNYYYGQGCAYIYYGGGIMDNGEDVFMTVGGGSYNYFGWSVSGAGDVNDDGYDDVIVGAYGRASAYVYYGGGSMDNTADVVVSEAASRYGKSVSDAGDVNDDGYDDVIVGAGLGNTAYIYYGGGGMNSTADVVMTGEGGYFAESVSGAGDVNRDGYDDVIVGDYSANGWTGRAYIYYGDDAMDNTADVVFTGGSGAGLGVSVSGAGDVDNDGRDDVIIGAQSANAYIYGVDSSPIAVKLSSFAAMTEKTGIVLTWETQSENSFAGYYIYRRQEPAQEFTRINKVMIPAMGTSTSGAKYQYIDVPPAGGNYVYQLQSVNLDGSSEFSESVYISFSTQVERSLLPTKFALHQNYPNPFNPTTTIHFDLPVSSNVILIIYDARGRLVRTLKNGSVPAGAHAVVWDGRDENGQPLSSGLYFCKIKAGEFAQTQKMTLLK